MPQWNMYLHFGGTRKTAKILPTTEKYN